MGLEDSLFNAKLDFEIMFVGYEKGEVLLADSLDDVDSLEDQVVAGLLVYITK